MAAGSSIPRMRLACSDEQQEADNGNTPHEDAMTDQRIRLAADEEQRHRYLALQAAMRAAEEG
jgi:hypothetical protein